MTIKIVKCSYANHCGMTGSKVNELLETTYGNTLKTCIRQH